MRADARLAAFSRRLASLPQPGSVHLSFNATGVAYLTLQNAGRRNALTGPMMAALADRVDELEQACPSTWALILSGEGGHFCAGSWLCEFTCKWRVACEHFVCAWQVRISTSLWTT